MRTMTALQFTEPVPQDAWGLLIAIYLWLGGMGGAAAVAGAYAFVKKNDSRMLGLSAIIGFGALLVGSIMLILDLTQPANAYRVFFSPKLNPGSWITIGSWIIAFFMIVSLAVAVAVGSIPISTATIRETLEKRVRLLAILMAALGFGVSIYTGILIAVVKAIPFWNNALIPILFITSAGGTGVAALAVASSVTGDNETTEFLVGKVDYLITIGEILLVAILLLVALNGTVAEAASAEAIVKGSLAPLFWAGFLMAGVLIPIMLEKMVKTRWSLPLAALLVIIGGFFLRYVIIKAGYWELPF